jgi:hypothetical protein
MSKHISFTIAAAILGLAMVFWVTASVVNTNASVGPMFYSSAHTSELIY